MISSFVPADILLPKEVDYQKWAVIACDQFTSDRKYWDRVEKTAEGVPSTFHLIFPEIDLENEPEKRISKISNAMASFIADDGFQEYPASFIYVERTLLNGTIRPGVVGMVDLEQYHYDPSHKPSVGATEQTILGRVPPRLAIRAKAELEFPHIILFCNDHDNGLIAPLSAIKEQLPKLYDFDLMERGGHISGWLVTGPQAQVLLDKIQQYQDAATGTAFLVADGNHSLVTAKCWYEELKKNNPGKDMSSHPARYALVELENILDPSIDFEPIHRVIFETDARKFVADMQSICVPGGCPVTYLIGAEKGTVYVDVPDGELPVAVLQKFLDEWLKQNRGRLDYVHDADAVESFAQQDNTVGLLLPVFDKEALFAFGAAGKILPRKTFSLGHGREKRYYLEGRRIR